MVVDAAPSRGDRDLGDRELWGRAAEDPEAFGTVFERHARAVFAFCVRRCGDRALAEDLTSIVFLEAWKQRAAFEPTGTTVLPWLLGIANNMCRNATRSRRRHRAALRRIPLGPSAAGVENDVVSRVDTAAALESARRALDGLSRHEREVVVLVSWSDLTYGEAAAALGVPVGTVRSRLARARRKLCAARDPSGGTGQGAPDGAVAALVRPAVLEPTVSTTKEPT